MKFRFPWQGKSGLANGRLGVAIGPDGMMVAHVDSNQDLAFCKWFAHAEDNEQVLSHLVDKQGWKDVPCSLVLHPLYYKLMQAEAPEVEQSEMADAVRWRLKELLDFPVEDAAIEYFMLPEDAYRGRQKVLYAAALRKDALQNLVDPMQSCGLNIDCIEISELALNNLVCRIPAERGGFAVLQLQETGGYISMVEDGQIYLCRRFEIGLNKFSEGESSVQTLDALLLEIQRSLDFYDSQLGKGAISKIYYPALPGTNVDIGEYLSGQLFGMGIEELNLSQAGLTADSDSALCAVAVGAALGPREDAEETDAAH